MNEFNLIKQLSALVPTAGKGVAIGIGDDAAVIETNNKKLVVTTDSLVEHVHFERSWFTPKQLGERLVAVTISDIAAMGGNPKYILISLTIPPLLPPQFIQQLYKGIGVVCRKYSSVVIGGNISKGNQLAFSATAIGEISKPIVRSGAQVGDALLVTGILGDAAGGLFILRNKLKEKTLIKKWVSPTPRIEEGKVIAKYATAMIDISDSLSNDLLHLCEQSRVGVTLFTNAILLSKALKKAVQNPLDFAINGGEDYELLFTAQKNSVEQIVKEVAKRTKTTVTVIGEIIAKEQGHWIINPNGTKGKLIAKGWNHLQQ